MRLSAVTLGHLQIASSGNHAAIERNEIMAFRCRVIVGTAEGLLRFCFTNGGRNVPQNERVVAVGLLTARDLKKLGPAFSRAFPVDETPCFGELLRAIDDADRILRTGRLPPK